MDEAWEPMERDCKGKSTRVARVLFSWGGRRMQTNEVTSDAVKKRTTGTIDVTRRQRCRNGRVDEDGKSLSSVSGRCAAAPQIALIGLADWG
jgi:hypothetical protein